MQSSIWVTMVSVRVRSHQTKVKAKVIMSCLTFAGHLYERLFEKTISAFSRSSTACFPRCTEGGGVPVWWGEVGKVPHVTGDWPITSLVVVTWEPSLWLIDRLTDTTESITFTQLCLTVKTDHKATLVAIFICTFGFAECVRVKVASAMLTLQSLLCPTMVSFISSCVRGLNDKRWLSSFWKQLERQGVFMLLPSISQIATT